MCGRYFIQNESNKLNEIISKAKKSKSTIAFQTGDLFPTNQAPILIGIQHKIYARFASWGFHQKIINAKAETVTEKSLFKTDFSSHRALVPASGFYEWDSFKKIHSFQAEDGHPLYFAAIYNDRQEFTIITCPAKDPVRAVHDRMPLCLSPNQFSDWLFDTQKAKELLVGLQTPKLVTHTQNTQFQEILPLY